MNLSQLKTIGLIIRKLINIVHTPLSTVDKVVCYTTNRHFKCSITIRFCHVLNKKLLDTPDEGLSEVINPVTISRFSEILGLPENEIVSILQSSSDIRKFTGSNLSSRLSFLAERNITIDMIRRYPWLLTENKRLMDMKLELIKCNTNACFSGTLCLLKLSIPRLRQFLDRNKVNPTEGQQFERIAYFVDKLQCDEKKACELLNKHEFLLTLPFKRIQTIVALLEEAGVLREDILKDPYILRYSPESIKPRIQEAQNIGMTKMKPWLVRSQQDVFYRSLQRYKDIKEQMGTDPSIAEFLLRRLKLESSDQVTEIFRIQPRLLHSTARKLGTAITALELEGYTCEQIANCPRVLAASIKTVIGRLRLLRELEPHKLPNLSTLAFSSKKFSKHVNRIKIISAIH